LRIEDEMGTTTSEIRVIFMRGAIANPPARVIDPSCMALCAAAKSAGREGE
jgi:hypothetical protein